jgi:hypothetical protein
MKNKKLKRVLTTGFLLPVLGWLIFALFFAPENFFKYSEPPLGVSTDFVSLLYFFLFILGIAIPILCLLGLAILSILGLHDCRNNVTPDWFRE